jgi:protein-tyrosine-phosphatase
VPSTAPGAAVRGAPADVQATGRREIIPVMGAVDPPAQRRTDHGADDVVLRLTEDLAGLHRGVLTRAEVEDVVRSCFEELEAKARITAYLPVLTRRRAEIRLVELAQERQESAHPVPKVVFVCRRNEGRSQLAAALLDHHAKGRVDVRATGTEPTGRLNPVAVQALAELGVTLAEPYPQPPSDALIRMADVVVNMGAADDRPDVTGARYVDWDLPDPAGRPLEEVRTLRDELDRRVRALLDDLTARTEGGAAGQGGTPTGRWHRPRRGTSRAG